MPITHESITTPGKEIDSDIAALKTRVTALESRTTTASVTSTNDAPSWIWDSLGRWGLTTSASRVRAREAQTITGWQVVAPSDGLASAGTATIELRVDGTVADTIVWDLADGPSARSDQRIAIARDAEVVPWVTAVGGLPAGEEITDVSIEVWREI